MKRDFRDDLGRVVQVEWPPQRVVSLVASQTETLLRLGLGARLAGRTRFCVEPAGEVEAIPTVGGEKSPIVDRILELRPDLVIANKEENKKADVDRLDAAGVPVYVAYPRTFEQAAAMIEDFGRLTDLERPSAEMAGEIRAEAAGPVPSPALRALVFIWKKPWMTVGSDTFMHDLLRLAGAENVAASLSGRYPRVELPQALALAPELILLPDEPFAFGAGDQEELESAARPERPQPPSVLRLDGKLLTWYGSRMGRSLRTLRELLAPYRAGVRHAG